MKPSKFHALLSRCIEEFGSQRAFAKQVGIGQSTINDWLYKEAPQVQTRLLKRLAERTSIPYKAWLGSLIENEEIPGEPIPPPLPGDIPVIAFAKGGDKGFFDEQGYPVGEGFRKTKRPYDLKDPNAYGVEVRGSSMAPKFEEKETLIVSPAESVVNGNYVVVKTTKGESMVKRIFFRDGLVVLESFNEPPLIYKKEEVLFYHKVVWVKQRG